MNTTTHELERRLFLKGAAATAAAVAIPATAQSATAASGQAGATPDAMALAQQLSQGEVTPLEVLDAAITRIEALPKLNAVVLRDFDLAREQAKKLSMLGRDARPKP